MPAAELTFYYNLTTLGKTAQGENCTKRNDKIWKLRKGRREMVCIQDDMCYKKDEEIAPVPDIRKRLREEILSLSNKQAEYVLRALQRQYNKEGKQ